MVLFKFSDIITFSSGILYVVASVLLSVCCLVTIVVPGFLNLPLIYLILLDRVQYYSILCILRICVADGPLPNSYRASARLVRYLMLISSAWFFSTFLTDYADRSPVVFSVSLTLVVTCVN